MLKILLKKQLSEIFRSYFYDAKKNKARSRLATCAYMVFFVVLMVGVLGGLFTYLSLSICRPLAEAGMGWLYFALMGLLAIFLGVFGSVFNTYSSLYLAKDNDLLLSMPVPVNAVMLSRLLGVYLMGLMYSGVVILPAVIVYLVTVSAGAGAIAGAILLPILISLFVLTLSCALGWVVAKISLKLKNKSFITVLISLLFLGGYYFFYFKAQTLLSQLIANAAVYGAKIRGTAYPIYLFGMSGLGDPVGLIAVAIVVLALFALMWALISRSFLKIATSSGKTVRKEYRETRTLRHGVSRALLGREMAHFTSSANYMLNCGLGVLFLFIGGVALLWKAGDFLPVLETLFSDGPEAVPVLLCAAVCALCSMNDMTAPSVSLEGKTLWLAQSMPVTPWQVLQAKLRLQWLLSSVPTLFCAVCAGCLVSASPLERALTILLPVCFALFTALLGLTLGLKMPNLTWTSEITPIKQSACVVVTLLAGFLYAGALAVVYFLVGYRLNLSLYLGLFALLTLAASAALYFWIKTRGSRRFATL